MRDEDGSAATAWQVKHWRHGPRPMKQPGEAVREDARDEFVRFGIERRGCYHASEVIGNISGALKFIAELHHSTHLVGAEERLGVRKRDAQQRGRA